MNRRLSDEELSDYVADRQKLLASDKPLMITEAATVEIALLLASIVQELRTMNQISGESDERD